MIVIKVICWFIIVWALFGKDWKTEHYLANTLAFITALVILFLSYGGLK